METEKLKGSRLFPTLWSDFFDNGPFFTPGWPATETKDLMPAANIRENRKSFTVELAMPGFRKEDFVIDADGGRLSVRAEKEEEKESEDDRYTRREFSCRSVARSFTLPENVDSDAIEASYREGILKLSIPKKEEAKALPKKEIRVA